MKEELSAIRSRPKDHQDLNEDKKDLLAKLKSSEEQKEALEEQLRRASDEKQALLERAESTDHVKAENEKLKQQLQEAMARVTEMDNMKKQVYANQDIVVNNDEIVSQC